MIPLLLAACTATTSIPEFSDKIEKACLPGIVSIDISGDHEVLTEALVLDKDFAGRDMDYKDFTGIRNMAGSQAAVDSAIILDRIYPMKLFIFEVRDRKRRPLCRFEVTDDATTGRCAAKVVP